MWNDDDVSSMESWHEANSAHCVVCGERWLVEQMICVGAVYCPDCVAELSPLVKLQVACEAELVRMRTKVIDAAMRALRDSDPLVIRCRELNQ